MGIIRQGILGGLSGKVGNVVGASWKGIDYLRALPSQVANPNTIGQRTSRSKMSLVVKFLRSCTALVRIGFSGFSVKMSAFNAATSYNLQESTTGEYPVIALDYQKLSFSRGNLPGALNGAAAMGLPGTVDITWDDNSGSGTAKADDSVMLLLYNGVKQVSVFKPNGGTRSAGASTVEVPAEWSGDDVHCYIAFTDLTKSAGTQPKDYTSNTVYLGTVIIA